MMRIRARSPAAGVLQLAGLAIGVSLLVWAVRLSMSEENARSLAAMRAAPASEVVALFACTLAGIVLNGLMFWVTLRPLRRLSIPDTLLTNAIATFLSILPFKLGLMTRVLIHHRRDGVPLKLLVGWVAAMGALALASLGPLVAAGLWRGAIDALWWTVVLGGTLVGGLAAVTLGRLAEHVPWLRVLSLGSHQVVRHAGAVIAHGVLRLMDVAMLAGRFLAASMIVDAPLALDQAVLLSTTYFLLSVVSPAGNLGVREMGVAAIAFAQGQSEHAVALIALVVTAAEALASGSFAAVGFVRLRLDRLLVTPADGVTRRARC
jgi:hypothetical protein